MRLLVNTRGATRTLPARDLDRSPLATLAARAYARPASGPLCSPPVWPQVPRVRAGSTRMRSRDSQARHPRLARAALVVGTSRVAARRASGTGGFGLRLLHLDATPVLRHLLLGLKRAGIERAVITLDVKSNALAASLQADPMLAGASSLPHVTPSDA